MENHIRLKWTSHQGTVLSVFDALLSTESLVDVTLACEGQYVRAHKMILSACSPYFQELINVDVNKHPIFFLKDVKYNELKAIIHYMYRGEVNIAQEDLQSLLSVAQALKIRGLAEIETGNHSISNGTNILPDTGTKRVVKVPPEPVDSVAPPLVLISPNTSKFSNVSRTSIHSQEHSFVSQQSVAATCIPTVTVPTGRPACKKNRVDVETRLSSSQTDQVQMKQSQIVDPLRDIQSTPSTASAQCLDPLQTTSLPTTSSSHYESTGHSHSGHSQDTSYGHTRMVEDIVVYESGLKMEGTNPIEIDLEDEEEDNSMSQSSFSESWRLGDGDNSGMADDGETAGGSGGGVEGGEGQWVEVNRGENTRKWSCEVCGKTYSRSDHLRRHEANDCQNKSEYRCSICNFRTKWKDNLTVHFKRHNNTM